MTTKQRIKSVRARLKKLDSEIEDLEDKLDRVHVSIYKKIDKKKIELENLEAVLDRLESNNLQRPQLNG